MEVEKQTKQVSETAERAAMGPEGGYVGYVGYVDLSLTREAGSEANDAGATLEQLKDGPKLVSATEATT